MKKVYKSLQNKAFNSLDKRHQNAIRMLFEGELTDEQIAKNVNRSRQTIAKWKKDPVFKKAQAEYKRIAVKEKYEGNAIKKLNKLLEAKSEMVQLQAANSILKLSGMLSENSTPELDKAKIRKANAEASISELKADVLKQQAKEADPDNEDSQDDSLADAVSKGMKGLFDDDDEIET